MKGTRHSEEQIIAILKQGEAGLSTAELCRQHGDAIISEAAGSASYYQGFAQQRDRATSAELGVVPRTGAFLRNL